MDFNDFNTAQYKLKDAACKIAELNFPWEKTVNILELNH